METHGTEKVPLIRLPFPTTEGHSLLLEVARGANEVLGPPPSPVAWGPLPLGLASRYTRKNISQDGAEFASSWISGADNRSQCLWSSQRAWEGELGLRDVPCPACEAGLMHPRARAAQKFLPG